MRPLDSTNLNYKKHQRQTNSTGAQIDIVKEITKRKTVRRGARTKTEGYRTGYDIMYEVLLVLTKTNTPLTASRMAAYSGLSYAQLKEFLIGIMFPAELVKFEDNNHLKVLPAGYEYMKIFMELRNILRLEDTSGGGLG